MNRLVLSLLALVAAFAAGYAPQHDKVRELEREIDLAKADAQNRLSSLELKRDLLTLQSHLGMALIDIEERNYGQARHNSAVFFAGVCHLQATTANEGARQLLGEVCSRRDEIAGDLASMSREVARKLRHVYMKFPTMGDLIVPAESTSAVSGLAVTVQPSDLAERRKRK